MVLLDVFEDFYGRFGRIDHLGRSGECFLLSFQFLHSDLENFFRRKIDQFGFCEEALILFGTNRELGNSFWEFLFR